MGRSASETGNLEMDTIGTSRPDGHNGLLAAAVSVQHGRIDLPTTS
jgi:hypothetical protein